jgi:hypothetical protein
MSEEKGTIHAIALLKIAEKHTGDRKNKKTPENK